MLRVCVYVEGEGGGEYMIHVFIYLLYCQGGCGGYELMEKINKKVA